MSPDYHVYETSKGHGLKHDPMLAIVGPRPIGWISSHDPGGRLNLAPFSFFNILNGKPPLIGFSPNGRKDSVCNAEATGNFVWNLATRPLAEAMNLTSSDVPMSVDEFEVAGLTPAPSIIVSAPRVAESPVSLECKLTEIVQLKNARGENTNGHLVLGEVVAVHIAKSLLVDGVYNTAKARPISRGGGNGDYFEILRSGYFRLPRPSAELVEEFAQRFAC